MLRLSPCVSAVSIICAASCGGARNSPAAASGVPLALTAPAPASPVSLNGRVTETPPTPTTGIEGAIVTIADGANAGRSVTTNPFGFYTISDLQPGAFTISVAANDYVAATQHLSCATNSTSDVQLRPVPKTITDVLSDQMDGTEGTCSDGLAQRPCRIIAIPVHNTGAIDATLTWTPTGAADLDLALFQTGGTTAIARSANGGTSEHITATLTVPADYEFHITYAGAAKGIVFTLRLTHMN